MSFIRGLQADLVDKKLWPLAVALVVGVIAVPLLLSKHSSAPNVAAQPAASVNGAPVQSAPGTPITDVTVTGGLKGRVRGDSRDPFKQQHVPAPASTGLNSSGSGVTSSTGSSGSGSTSSSTSTTSTTSTTTTVIRKQFIAQVRFSRIGGKAARLLPYRPGTALPSNADPLVVYLGKLKKSRSVAFLVSGDVIPSGEGRCANNHVVCDAVILAPGDIEYFERPLPNGRSVRYRLQFVKTYLG
jgi:hypothetical protein